jgi:hypothetical protein
MAQNKSIGLWEQLSIGNKGVYIKNPLKGLNLDIFGLLKEQYIREIDDLFLTGIIDETHKLKLHDLINSSDKESNDFAVNILKTYQYGHIYKKK